MGFLDLFRKKPSFKISKDGFIEYPKNYELYGVPKEFEYRLVEDMEKAGLRFKRKEKK